MTNRETEDWALNALFATARTKESPADADFMSRLTADATAAAHAHASAASRKRPSPSTPAWQRWFPAAGLATATLAGLWIGVSLPGSTLEDTYLTTLDTGLNDFMPTFGVAAFSEDGS